MKSAEDELMFKMLMGVCDADTPSLLVDARGEGTLHRNAGGPVALQREDVQAVAGKQELTEEERRALFRKGGDDSDDDPDRIAGLGKGAQPSAVALAGLKEPAAVSQLPGTVCC